MELEDLRQHIRKAGFTVSPRDDIEPAAVASILECTLGHLANLRSRGEPPAYAKLPCGIRYPIGGLMEYLETLVRNRAA